MTSWLRTFISSRSARIINFLYPILFWALVLRLSDMAGFALVRQNPLPYIAFARQLLLYYALAIFVIVILWGSRESIIGLRPYKQVKRELPDLMGDLIGSGSADSEQRLVSEIQGLLVKTRTAYEIRMMRIMTLIAQVGNLKKLIPVFMFTNLLVYVGLILLTVQVYFSVSPVVTGQLPWIGIVSNSPLVISVLLFVLSALNFESVVQEIQMPAWQAVRRAYRTNLFVIFRFIEEFTIFSRALRAIDGVVWGLAFSAAYRSRVECPDGNTLAEIAESSLNQILGKSSVLVYHAVSLYPASTYPELASLDENILSYWSDNRLPLLGFIMVNVP